MRENTKMNLFFLPSVNTNGFNGIDHQDGWLNDKGMYHLLSIFRYQFYHMYRLQDTLNIPKCDDSLGFRQVNS